MMTPLDLLAFFTKALPKPLPQGDDVGKSGGGVDRCDASKGVDDFCLLFSAQR